MKLNFSLSFLLGCLVLGAPAISHADTADGEMINTAIVAPLMAWVEKETGVQVSVLPTVIASHTRLAQTLARRSESYPGRPQSLFAGSTIIMNDRTWDPEDPTQISLLVHELVHYAQSFTPRAQWACFDAKEQQAYTLQNKWLDQHGRGPFVTAAWIERVSQCSEGSGFVVAQRQ